MDKETALAKYPYLIKDGGPDAAQLAILRNCKIALSTPMYGGMCQVNYFLSVLGLVREADKLGIKIEPSLVYNEALIHRARNCLVHTFLKHEDFTHLLFIDADIGFNPGQFFEVLIAAITQKKPLVGAVYPQKTVNWPFIAWAAKEGGIPPEHLHLFAGRMNVIARKDQPTITEPLELFPVSRFATGYMLISRELLLTMQEKYPENWYCANDGHMPGIPGGTKIWRFFASALDEDRTDMSEDWYFCDLANKIGVIPHIAPWVQLTHSGYTEYRGVLPIQRKVLTPSSKIILAK